MIRGMARLRRARIAVTTGCVVSLLALVLFSLNGEYQDGLARASAESARPVALDVALVNEDRGVGVGDDQVNLGRGYVTQVESDTTAAWHVLSRGVAERGLAAGSYHLLVVIPGEFSEKLLDLESTDPSPITVTYQVNGKGNARVESVATRRGQEIVSDLNGQLVDMYVASILGNLRQAQEGVRTVVDSEAEHVLTFTDELDPATRALGESLDVLTGSTDGSIAVNDDLVAGLDAFGIDQQTSVQDLADHDTSLADLLAARAEGELTYGAFLEALLAMDSRLLSEEVGTLAEELSGTGAALEQQLAEGTGDANHAAAVAELTAAVQTAVGSTQQRADDLGGRLGGVIPDDDLRADLAARGWDLDAGVTLGDVVEHQGVGTGTTPVPTAFGAVLDDVIADRIARLPYLDDPAIQAAEADGLLGHAGHDAEALAHDLQQALGALRDWDGFSGVVADPDDVVGGDLEALVDALGTARDELTGSHGPSDGAEVSEPAATPDPAEVDGLVVASADYGAALAQITQAYEQAVALVELARDCVQTCGLHPDTDVTAAVVAVIQDSVRHQIGDELEHVAELDAELETLKAASGRVGETTAALRETSRTLATSITGQLDELARMRQSMREVLDGERTSARAVADVDRRTQEVVAEALALTSSSERLAASALQAADQARGVTDLLASLRADVTGLLEDSAALDEKSTRLTTALTGQVDVSTEFADSFSGVLSNAHSSGVLNERLMQFLVAPVSPAPREAVTTSDVTRPFSWVLISATLCLAAAAVLAGRRPPAAREQDPAAPGTVFARRDGAWLRRNAVGLATSALAGAALGGLLAWASARNLDVPREQQMVWGAAMVLTGLAMILVSRWLIVQFRAVGVGLCALLLVGYVFVSDAVGTGAASGLSRTIVAIGPLSRAESTLTGVLGADGPGVTLLGGLAVTVLVAALANLLVVTDARRLVPRRWRGAPA